MDQVKIFYLKNENFIFLIFLIFLIESVYHRFAVNYGCLLLLWVVAFFKDTFLILGDKFL